MARSRCLSRCARISMAKRSSNFSSRLGRLAKIALVAALLPLVIGLLVGVVKQLEAVSVSGDTLRRWVGWGAASYLGMHLLLYRPKRLFRANHRLWSWVAVWLFGGQVASVEQAPGADAPEAKRTKGARGSASTKPDTKAQGSTLVAFSPYVIPFYTILVCAVGWGLRRWYSPEFPSGPVGFLVGLTMAFHWLMTADDLQERRAQWHIETYLLAVSLTFVLTLLVAAAALAWAVPGFSCLEAFVEGAARAQAIYTTLIQRLFF